MPAWAIKFAVMAGVALSWHLFFDLNEWLLASYTHASWANWIFMPAALRIVAVLLFKWVGAFGLMLGALYEVSSDAFASAPYRMILAVSSGLAPALAVWLCRIAYGIADDLQGLRARHVAALSIIGAAANSLLISLTLLLAGQLRGDLLPLVVIFLGDLNGTALVLFAISAVLPLLPTKGSD